VLDKLEHKKPMGVRITAMISTEIDRETIKIMHNKNEGISSFVLKGMELAPEFF